MTHTKNTGSLSRNEIDICESLAFTCLALIEHCPDAFDVHHRTICKSDSTNRPAIDAGECRMGPRHVIRGPDVQHPPAGHLLSTITECGIDLLFDNVDYLRDAAGLADDLVLRCDRCRSPCTMSPSRARAMTGSATRPTTHAPRAASLPVTLSPPSSPRS
jgi:hypothetical protein